MTIYVDDLYNAKGPRGHVRWCHMAVGWDEDLEELHNMAVMIGLHRGYFQDDPNHPHYDLTPSKRALAIRYGAIPLDWRGWVRRCSRQPKVRAALAPQQTGSEER